MLSLLLTQTTVGSLIALLLVPPPAAGRRFFQFTVALCGTLLLLGILLMAATGQRAPARLLPHLMGAALLLVSAGLFHVGRLRAGSGVMVCGLLAAAAGVLADATALVPAHETSVVAGLLYPLDALTAGLVPGTALISMILGHYYLTIPGLAIQHLQRLSVAFMGAIAARAIVLAVSMSIHGADLRPLLDLLFDFDGRALPADGLDPFVLVFLTLHLLFGIVAPAVFAIMAWRTSRISSTQSATGILYIALVVVIMGEMAGRYLVALTGLPL